MIKRSPLLRGVAQIRVDPARAPVREWCWRDDWIAGGESIYCLLAMFEALNVVHGRDVTEVFVEPSLNARGKPVFMPTLDLRSAERLRLAKFSAVTRVPVEVARTAFVMEAFSETGRLAFAHLRWCPDCLRCGYHSMAFQLPVTHACPAHGTPLRNGCPRCRSQFPYKLGGTVKLFVCPSCKLDLAPVLRGGWCKPSLRLAHRRSFDDFVSLLQFCDRLPTMVAQAWPGAGQRQAREFLVSRPRVREQGGAFMAFVTQVLVSLRASAQMQLLPVVPSCTFIERRRAALKGDPRRRDANAAGGWPAHLVTATDSRLRAAASIYRCVRRSLWRHTVRAHRACVCSTTKTLWWPLIGSETGAFCPVAMAFVRWRMHWEAASTAAALRARPRSAPLGLVGWLAAVAPVPASTWTEAMDRWLTAHVLARDLTASFEAMLRTTKGCARGDVVTWEREPAFAAARTCWVCAGRGTWDSPGRLFVDASEGEAATESWQVGVDGRRRHFRDHLGGLLSIAH